MTSNASNQLRLLFWESTSRCNLACIHCRRQDVPELSETVSKPAAPSPDSDLTTAEFKMVIGSAATLGRPVIVFSGGEPLMRSDWQELAAYARSLGLPTALATNGTLVDQQMAARIAQVGLHRVSVSLDGATAAVHDAFRGVAGAFDRAMAGIAHMRKAGVKLQINATIANHNIHQLDDLYAMARRLDVVALHLFLLVPVGCGAEIGESHQLPPGEYERVLVWICDKQEELQKAAGVPGAPAPSGHAHASASHAGHPGGGHPANVPFELKATCAPHYYRIAAKRGLLKGPGRGCLCGSAVIFVSHKGEVFPCGYLPVECGNVRQQELADIWNNSPVLASLRDDNRLGGKCGRCEFRGICGGCRARALSQSGDLLAEEPSCTYQPKKKKKKKKKK